MSGRRSSIFFAPRRRKLTLTKSILQERQSSTDIKLAIQGWSKIRRVAAMLQFYKSIPEFVDERQQNYLERGESIKDSGDIGSRRLWRIYYDNLAYHFVFKAFISVFLMWSIILYPIRVGFNIYASPFDTNWWIDITMDIIFMSETVSHFFLVDYNDMINNNDSLRYTAKRYLKSSFLLDFITSVPLQLINEGLFMIKLMRIFRLNFVLSTLATTFTRLPAQIGNIISLDEKKSEEAKTILLEPVTPNPQGWGMISFPSKILFLRLLNAFIVLLAYTHLLSMLSLAVRYYDDSESHTWSATSYIEAFYFTMTTFTTVGYGDLSPNLSSSLEVTYVMIFELIGIALFALLIGTMNNYLKTMESRNGNKHHEKVDDFLFMIARQNRKRRRFVQNLDFEKTKATLLHSIDYNYRMKLKEEHSFLMQMPFKLRKRLLHYAFAPLVQKFRHLFKGLPVDLVQEILMCAQARKFFLNDLVIEGGKLSRKLYLIERGSMSLTLPGLPNAEVLVLPPGSFFGEFSLFLREGHFELYDYRPSGKDGDDHVVLLEVGQDSITKILKRYPKEAGELFEQALLRYKILKDLLEQYQSDESGIRIQTISDESESDTSEFHTIGSRGGRQMNKGKGSLSNSALSQSIPNEGSILISKSQHLGHHARSQSYLSTLRSEKKDRTTSYRYSSLVDTDHAPSSSNRVLTTEDDYNPGETHFTNQETESAVDNAQTVDDLKEMLDRQKDADEHFSRNFKHRERAKSDLRWSLMAEIEGLTSSVETKSRELRSANKSYERKLARLSNIFRDLESYLREESLRLPGIDQFADRLRTELQDDQYVDLVVPPKTSPSKRFTTILEDQV